MFMLRTSRLALLALLVQASCVPLLDDSCGPVMRETGVRGEIRDAAGTRLATAQVSLMEVRGGDPPRRILAIVMGPGYGSAGAPLKGHVTRARLVSGSTGQLLHEMSVAPGLADEVLRTEAVPVPDAAVFESLRSRFLAGDVVLELETSLPGREKLRTPLQLQSAGKWSRAHCS